MLEKIKDAILIIPAAHFGACFIYLFFYYSSFGNGLVYFSGPSDVFSVSFADVAPAYVTLFLVTGVMFWLSWDPIKGNVFRHEKMSEEQYNKALPTMRRLSVGFKWLLTISVVIGTIGSFAYLIATGFRLYSFEQLSLQCFILLACIDYVEKYNLTKNQYDMTMTTLLVLTSLMFSGLNDGQNDRARPDLHNLSSLPKCKDLTILRGVSVYYLAVQSDNGRILVNDECEARTMLVRPEDFKPLPQSIGEIFGY